MKSVLSLESVAFQYGDVPVLNGVSLELEPGCFLGLVGPNGSGKTTLLRIAAGLVRPSGGTVRLNGRHVEEMSRAQVARHIALLPQSPNLPGTFTAWELVLMGRTPFLGFLGRESERDLAAAERAMGLAQCEHLSDRKMGELSGGERQRVLMARALAQEPEILLLDEPTAHLDIQHQIAAIDMVADLVAGGMAALGVFHDLNLAACYCHRLAVLSQGRLRAAGTPEEVLRADILREVFQVDLCLSPHPQGGAPAVFPPLPRRGSGSHASPARTPK
jgi:iron complex transport system ATP-binding protein